MATMVTAVFNTTVKVILSGNNDDLLTGLEETRQTSRIAIEIFSLLIMWMLSIPMNVLVCLVIYRSRRVQSTTNYFVVSLALSDLLVAIFCVPFIATRVIASRWVFGSIMCRLIRFIQALAPTASIFVLVVISIDRFYSIIYPLSFKITRGTAKHLISCCWILSFIVCVFTVYFFEAIVAKDGSNKEICPTVLINRGWTRILYSAVYVIVTFMIPACFVLIVYSRIFRYVWTAGVGQRRVRRTTNPVPRAKVKMLKMLIIVSVVSLSSMTPFYVSQLWYTFSSSLYMDPTIFIASFWILFLPTILKPVIYMWYNLNFRRGCREVFCMSNMKCYRSNTYAITTSSNIGKKNHVGVMTSDHALRRHSPTMVFNRNIKADRTAWPMAASISTTYI